VAKTQQTFYLRSELGDRMAIVDYDDLVSHQEQLLPELFEFAAAPFDERLLRHLHGKSVHKGSRLTDAEAQTVDEMCAPIYESARRLCTIGSAK
jgi:hypothetical protein